MALYYFSTNPWIKWYICNRWRGDVHFVWCSEVFDPSSKGASHYGSLIPPTSSPCAIYKDLAAAVRGRDRHNAKIVAHIASISARAEKWRADGEITDAVANEILAIVNRGDFDIWRPMLYIIPCAAIAAARVELVPIAERAGLGDEFRIKDLKGAEFEGIMFDGF
jgi:hypothetical protein